MRFGTVAKGAHFLLASAIVLVAVLVLSASSQAATNPRTELLREMNSARKAHGLKPLKLNATLTKPAVSQSRYLANTGRLDHMGADGSPFWVRFYRAGYSKRKAIGENLGMVGGCNSNAGRMMVRMWLDSPGHRRNLLSKAYRNVGLAIVSDSGCRNTVYATAFGG